MSIPVVSPAAYDIAGVARQGATLRLPVRWEIDGAPVRGVTGAKLEIRAARNRATVLLAVDEDSGVVIDETHARFIVTVSAATMAGVQAGQHVYEFTVSDDDGTVVSLLSGRFDVRPGSA